jgi:hypothetical protein
MNDFEIGNLLLTLRQRATACFTRIAMIKVPSRYYHKLRFCKGNRASSPDLKAFITTTSLANAVLRLR